MSTNSILANSIVTFDEDGKPIPNEVAKLLIQTYRKEEGWGDGKTRGIWFTKDEIKEIWDLIDSKQGDGIRIYLGKYPSSEEVPDLPRQEYKNRETIVFVLTKSGGKDVFNVLAPIDLLKISSEDAYNHGKICPPDICPSYVNP